MLIQRSTRQKEISVSSSRNKGETISGSKVVFTDQKFEKKRMKGWLQWNFVREGYFFGNAERTAGM